MYDVADPIQKRHPAKTPARSEGLNHLRQHSINFFEHHQQYNYIMVETLQQWMPAAARPSI